MELGMSSLRRDRPPAASASATGGRRGGRRKRMRPARDRRNIVHDDEYSFEGDRVSTSHGATRRGEVWPRSTAAEIDAFERTRTTCHRRMRRLNECGDVIRLH